MKIATQSDLHDIYAQFQLRRDIFSHVRKDHIAEYIDAGECVYQDGVILTFHRNTVTAPVIQCSSYRAPAGTIIIHWLLNSQQFNGAAGRVFQQFIGEIVKPGRVCLSVRADNDVACKFYERQGMQVVGHGTWSKGTILGLIYWLRI